jgi:ABC-2 type transport system ATP-binding protein
MEKIVKIKKLKKYFGSTKAVDGVTFEVKRGEILGFLGPNGAGKTTTIRCLMNFISPNEGEIKIFNKNLNKHSTELKKRIGYLASSPRLFESWTGREHINLIKAIRKIKSDPKELISKLDYDPSLKVANLSTGNKQKLSLILSLMANPDLLIMDEPTLGLDPILQNTIYEILGELQKQGKTVLMSSHNLHEVEKICDRVVIIKQGQIVATEKVSQLKKRHLYSVKVEFRNGEFNKADFEKLKNVEIKKTHNNHRLDLTVKGDVNKLIKKLSSYDIKDININHADLEQIFLEFYK